MAMAQDPPALAAILAASLGASAMRSSPNLHRALEMKRNMILQHEKADLQAKARAIMPEAKLLADAADAALLSVELGEDPPLDKTDALARALLSWFKQDFFSWVDRPSCQICGLGTVPDGSGAGHVTDAEAAGGAARVETYRCTSCQASVRFPRYNNPGTLLETRRGRCGEWANCFTLCCRALGMEARMVFDWTDHVWTEYYSPQQRRWIHLDPCDTAYDRPLLYERGWGKKLTYVVAFSRDGVTDVSCRYTADMDALLPRRTLAPEAALHAMAATMTAQLRAELSEERRKVLVERDSAEYEELRRGHGAPSDSDEALPGRQTGSLEWRLARGETGSAHPKRTTTATPYARANDRQSSNSALVVGGVVRASGENGPAESAVRAFDGSKSTKWLDFGGGGVGGSCWLEYRLIQGASPMVLAGYVLTSANDEPNRDPAVFQLFGCPSGVDPTKATLDNWKELDSRSGVVFDARGASLSFHIPVAGHSPCVAWKLYITATRHPAGANCCQLAGLSLLAAVTSRPADSQGESVQELASTARVSLGSTELSLLQRILGNFAAHPGEAKYQTLKETNSKVWSVVSAPAASALLYACGFCHDSGTSGSRVWSVQAASADTVRLALSVLSGERQVASTTATTNNASQTPEGSKDPQPAAAADKSPAVSAANSSASNFEAAVRAEFERLMSSGGYAPNEAAAQALKVAREACGPSIQH